VTWGDGGSWGSGSPWGTGAALPPPTLISVASPLAISTGLPAIVERRGGTVCRVLGTNFFDPLTIEILRAAVVVGTGYLFDAEFDLNRTRAFVGMPALADGFYDLRVTTEGGDSNVLTDALEYRLVSEQVKIHRVRIGYSAPWITGPRLLTNPTTGL
jgi:hypothetical protein